MEITYLLNSGFLVRLSQTLLVFDDFRDPAHAVEKALAAGGFRRLYILASHSHGDHFSGHIMGFAGQVTKYILSDDIRFTATAGKFPGDKTVYLPTYADWHDGYLKVASFDSTDIGTSFLVEAEGVRLFHAGDFNWWHWSGDTPENIKLAENGFKKQMKRLENLSAEVAFFPVDGRLGAAWDMGAKEFCARTQVKALVTMHNVGYPAWQPPAGFFAPGREIPCWSPQAPGETRRLEEGAFVP